MTHRIVARIQEPYGSEWLVEPDKSPRGAELGMSFYRIETTVEEAKTVEDELMETASEAMQDAEIDAVILDTRRYAYLTALYLHESSTRGAVDVSSRFQFDVYAVHGDDICQALYSSDKKLWEEFGE